MAATVSSAVSTADVKTTAASGSLSCFCCAAAAAAATGADAQEIVTTADAADRHLEKRV